MLARELGARNIRRSRVTLFMAADDSDGMTGQNVRVDVGIAQCSVMG